ncbi:MAG: NAD(P)-binding protein [Thermoplasmatales archaeon]|nr:NAD(P)-binding protein [Candidatus Thermoplasmatota archaeon]MCL6003324.1 NAD(P)-binding protein [Candidatus Thermoplasmatota archaeon]MDA8054137.1 NAD(P)-binding protein [Thermoplasmatales archaeon]
MKAFEPGYIGDLEIKNRIVMAPMISNLANTDGSSNENLVRYLEERARGGTGLIITEYTYVDNVNSRGSRNELGAYSSSLVPKLRRIPEAIHTYGSKVFMQLVHAGGKALASENPLQPMAPSAVDYLGRTPREMTEEDVESVIRSFERAAMIAKSSKFDGIEVHGAHGYLIHQFLSPKLNIREDRYGGSFEKRLTFPQTVIDTIRSATALPVGIRLSLYEDDPNGWNEDYGLRVVDELKNLDYVHLSAGNFYPPGSSASFYSPETHILPRMKKKPKITTMLVGSVVDLTGVERVLSKCEFVSVGRGHLADAFFAFKLKNNPGLLRPCIRCNQGCRDLSLGEVRCTVNASVGHEYIAESKLKGEVVIKGAGIQGLEAALYASKRGLKVTLHERDEVIGGQVNRIYDPYKKKSFSALLRYYENAIRYYKIELVTNSNFSGNSIECLPPITYMEPPEGGEVFESNVYANHDWFLRTAENKKIKVGKESLNSLDRGRKLGYISVAEGKGIEFIEGGDYDFSLMVDDQYDIQKAINLGIGKVKQFIIERENEFM